MQEVLFLVSCTAIVGFCVGDAIVIGPLLYHFADMPKEASIELSYDELRKVILQLNFEIVVSLCRVTSCI